MLETMVSEVYYEVHMTRVLHTARIGNVDSVIFVNTIREMVNFELGKEIDKDVFRLVMSVAQKKKTLSPHESCELHNRSRPL